MAGNQRWSVEFEEIRKFPPIRSPPVDTACAQTYCDAGLFAPLVQTMTYCRPSYITSGHRLQSLSVVKMISDPKGIPDMENSRALTLRPGYVPLNQAIR